MDYFFIGLIFAIPFVALGLFAGWQKIVSQKWPDVLDFTYEAHLTSRMRMPWGEVYYFDNRSVCSDPDATPIVFVHSFGSSLFSWRYQLSQFRNYPVFAFDHPGLGLSDKVADLSYDLDGYTERTLAVLDQAGIKECYLVGCSLGGVISLWLSSLYPERFLKTAAIAPAVTPNLLPIKNFNYLLLAKVSRMVPRSIIKKALSKAVYNQKLVNNDVLERYSEPYKDPLALYCFMKTVDVFKDQRVFTSLAHRKSDTLILWGSNDRVTTLSHMKLVQKQLKAANYEIHPWGGHHLMEDDPIWVNERIAKFFNVEDKISVSSP